MYLRFNLVYWLLAISSIYLLSSCSNSGTRTAQKDDINQYREKETKDKVAWGNYLVTIGGCNDCHSPKRMTPTGPMIDSSRMLSGHPANMQLPPFDKIALPPYHWIQMSPDLTAYVGPWGISYAANLTPDFTTGIGAWSENVFIKAIRTGKHLGQEKGREILPPMPWPEIAQMTDNDLIAVYQYLRSLPPINNRVPAPVQPNEAVK